MSPIEKSTESKMPYLTMLVAGLSWNVVFWFHVLVYRPTPSGLSIIVSFPMVVIGLLLVGWSRIKLRKMGRTAVPTTKLITRGRMQLPDIPGIGAGR